MTDLLATATREHVCGVLTRHALPRQSDTVIPISRAGHAPRPSWHAVALVTVVAWLASIWGIANQFVQDDAVLIRDNLRVHSLGQLGTILSSPYWLPPYPPDLYRPLLTTLHAVLYAVGDGSPLPFRLFSYGLYATSGWMLFRLASRLLPAPWPLIAAVVFAAHPVHVEAVALAVGHGELVVGIAAMAMSRSYLLARRRAGALRHRDVVFLTGAFVLAAGFKEHGLVVPALLLAAEGLLVSAPSLGARYRATRVLWVSLSVAAGALLLVRLHVLAGDPVRTFTAEVLTGLGVGGRALTMLAVVPEWFRLFTWPAHLRADYSPADFTPSSAFHVEEALGLGVILGATFMAWTARRRAPLVTFGLLWSGIMLLPVSNIVVPTGILLAERTLFVPSIGVVLAAAGAARWAAAGARASRLRAPAAALISCLVVAGVARSAERHGVWRQEQYFWYRAARDSPRSWRAQYAYGEVLFGLGLRAEAEAAFATAMAAAPEPWRLRTVLARWLRDLGDDAAAVRELRVSLAMRPTQPQARAELVAALIALGRYQEAAREA